MLVPFTVAFRALLLAPVGAVVVIVGVSMTVQGLDVASFGFVIALGSIWLLSLAAGVLFVLPILAFAPRSREPSFWVAAIWGASAGLAFASVVLWRQLRFSSAISMITIAAAGAASGLVYTLIVRIMASPRSSRP